MTSQHLDAEIQALAELAIANHFYEAFGRLINSHLAAAAGLNEDRLLERLSAMSNVYSAPDGKPTALEIVAIVASGPARHETLVAALQNPDAQAIELGGVKVFERRATGWYFTS